MERSFHFCPQCAAKIHCATGRIRHPNARTEERHEQPLSSLLFGVGTGGSGFGILLAVRQYHIINFWKPAESEVVKSQRQLARLAGRFITTSESSSDTRWMDESTPGSLTIP
jgi:hypothetical protein